MSPNPKKKQINRATIPDNQIRQNIAARRNDRTKSFSGPDDARRRNITLGIIGAGVLIAILIMLNGVQQHNVASAPAQSTSTPAQPTAAAQSANAAIGALQDRLRQNPDDQDAMIALGNAYYDAKQYTDAIPWYEKAVAKLPNNTDVRTDLGTAYYYTGNIDKAKQEWTEVLKQDPNKIQAHYNFGVLYSNLNPPDNENAAKEWQAVIKIDPNSDQAKSAQQKLKDMGK